MSAENANTSGATWPVPKFYFLVDFGDGAMEAAFQEVSGLDSENQIIEYRKSSSQRFSMDSMPGIVKYGNVTMKKGIFASDNGFWDWYDKIKMNTITRQTVVIKLVDENGAATMQWTLHNAWPTKITTTDLKAEGNEVAVETIELSFEKLTIANGG